MGKNKSSFNCIVEVLTSLNGALDLVALWAIMVGRDVPVSKILRTCT